MTNWEKFFDEKMKEVSKEKNILDVGSGIKFQKGMGKYKNLFSESNFRSLDLVSDYNPDILADIKNVPLQSGSVDAVICLAVLEHVDNPFLAVAEIHRILRRDGKCLLSLPFLYPYHAEKGYYQDFYRFTKDGIKFLFKDFSKIEICKIRGFFEMVTNLIPSKFLRKILMPISRIFDLIFKSKSQTSGYAVYLIK